MELSDTVRRLAFAYKSHESAMSIPGLEVLVRQPNVRLEPRRDRFFFRADRSKPMLGGTSESALPLTVAVFH